MAESYFTDCCKRCGAVLSSKKFKHGAKFCHDNCRRQFYVDEWRREHPHPLLPSATVGAISELLVATDLLKRGFAVFRAVSPACSCDLAVLRKDGTLLRIEVRTTERSKSGRVPSPFHKVREVGRFDVLAIVVLSENVIIYRPDVDG